jgi:arsenate reductase
MVPPDDIKPGFRGNRPRMGGDRKPVPPVMSLPTNQAGGPSPRSPQPRSAQQGPASAAPKKQRVLFVCIGNSCRSQMAEAFAKAYGADIMDVQSAGLAPATTISPLTKQILGERNLNMDGHFPKAVSLLGREPFDVVVNMSGQPAKLPGTQVLTWQVKDPIGESEKVYRTVAEQIEGLVMGLIMALRSGRAPG